MNLTDEYLISQYEELHKKQPGYGNGANFLNVIKNLIVESKSITVLDYGCGKGALYEKIDEMRGLIAEGYDPAVPGLAEPPDPNQKCYDVVVCNDVMEHLTEDTYDDVLLHIFSLAKNVVFFNISCRDAVHKLPDGQNCHTMVYDKNWWINEISNILGTFHGTGIIEWEHLEARYNPKNNNLVLILKSKNQY